MFNFLTTDVINVLFIVGFVIVFLALFLFLMYFLLKNAFKAFAAGRYGKCAVFTILFLFIASIVFKIR